jgi:FKBP-type peptidyl-prolyl cis-trans isomerase 2
LKSGAKNPQRRRQFLLGLIILLSAGCSLAPRAENRTIAHGEKVAMGFTCRLQSGEVAASTEAAIAQNGAVKKAAIFVPRQGEDPLLVVAGEGVATNGPIAARGFEGEIASRLARELPGMVPGAAKNVGLAAEMHPVPGEARSIDMARVRKRPKVLRMEPSQFESKRGRPARPGDDYTYDPLIPGVVAEVSEHEVVVRFAAEVGAAVMTPLGPGVIRETEENYEIHIMAKQGDLVRSSGMIGRVVAVNERMITINYGHPFGGEALDCEVVGRRAPEAIRN